MEKATGGAAEGIARRLSAVKVVVDLFNHELDLHKADRAINLDRERLDSMVTTLEMYIGDIEGLLRSTGGTEERRVVETTRATATRVT